MTIPTPKNIHEIQERLASTAIISDSEKKAIEAKFDESRGDAPEPHEVEKPKRPFVPVVTRLRDNPELQKLRDSLKQNHRRPTNQKRSSK
jgi:hypothetical protein